MNIPEHKRFFAVNSMSASSLLELRNMIAEMTEHDFKHHVSEERNDFANWIRDILHNDHLADRLQRVKSKGHTFELLNDEITKDKTKEHEFQIEKSYEFKRFIAKEFIYGMFFGLILGMILSRLI